MIQVSIQKLNARAILPERKTNGSAGYDLAACLDQDLVLRQGQVTLVPTGLAIAIPEGFEGQIRPRSGFSTKHRILMPNAPGTIDCDYRGEILVPLLNLSESDYILTDSTRIAQLLIKRFEIVHFDETEILPETERGVGGFGSTGK
jgi:dUTP pyrophosphatase